LELCWLGRVDELLLDTESDRVFGVPVCVESPFLVLLLGAAFLPLTASCSWLPCLPLGVAESAPHCLPCLFMDVSAALLCCLPALDVSCWAPAVAATPARSIAAATIALFVFMSTSMGPAMPSRW